MHKLLPSETILEDDYPVYMDYAYIVDNVFMLAPTEMTVLEWKVRWKHKEIRRCELFSHPNAKLGERVE